MTLEQSQALFRKLFLAFPHIHDFVNRAEQPEETLAIWYRVFASVDHATGQDAINRIISGRATLDDKPWELGKLALQLRAIAGRIADDNRKDQSLARLAAETAARRNVRAEYENTADRCRLSMYAGELFKEGIIDEEENRAAVEFLKSQNGDTSADVIVPDVLYRDASRLAAYLSRRCSPRLSRTGGRRTSELLTA